MVEAGHTQPGATSAPQTIAGVLDWQRKDILAAAVAVPAAIQVIAGFFDDLELQGVLVRFFADWRDTTRAIWTDAMEWLSPWIAIPYTGHELDVLSLLMLILAGAVASSVFGRSESVGTIFGRSDGLSRTKKYILALLMALLCLLLPVAMLGPIAVTNAQLVPFLLGVPVWIVGGMTVIVLVFFKHKSLDANDLQELWARVIAAGLLPLMLVSIWVTPERYTERPILLAWDAGLYYIGGAIMLAGIASHWKLSPLIVLNSIVLIGITASSEHLGAFVDYLQSKIGG